MIKIIAVGKIKDKELTTLINFYKKQVKQLEIIEIPDGKTEIDMVKEGEKILSFIHETDHVIAMAINGESYDSVSFANKLDKIRTYQPGNIVFIIGGSYGLSEAVYQRANEKISFSKLTFPHQLMRLFLVEQIFRAEMILKNHPYHK